MPDLGSSLKHLEESGARASSSRVDGCNPIWLLDDDAFVLRALGRLLNSAGFGVEKFTHPIVFLSRLKQAVCRVAGPRREDAHHERLGSAGLPQRKFTGDADYFC